MKKSRSRDVWLFFASVYLVSFLLYVPILVSGQGISTPLNKVLMAAVTFVPSVMGVLFVHLTKSPEEVRDFWRRAFRWPRGRTKMAILRDTHPAAHYHHVVSDFVHRRTGLAFP